MKSNLAKASGRGATRIAHLTTVHSPFDVRIFRKECLALAGADYEVTLIVPHDDAALLLDGIRVRTVPKANGRIGRMTATVWRVVKAALDENADCYHFHDPELIPAGLLLKALGKRVVYDVHENVPEDVLNKTYLPAFCRKMVGSVMGGIEYLGSASFDGIVAATPVIARRFPADKTITVQNFPIFGELAAKQSLPYSERPRLIAYVGGIAAIRGVEEMVRAMALVPESLNSRLALAGTFSPASLESAARQWPGWGCVDFLGWQSRADVANLLGRARIGLVLYHGVPGAMEAQPTKLFEYMSSGIPVIASDFSLWREIVESVGCGVLADPRDPKTIADAIRWLLEHAQEAEAMGMRGLQAVRSQFNWGHEAEKLLQFYQVLFAANSAQPERADAAQGNAHL